LAQPLDTHFEFESPKHALEWANLAIMETISDLGVARAEVVRCRDAAAHPLEDTSECLEELSRALVNSTAVWKSVVWRYWLWLSVANDVHARLEPTDVQELRLTTLEAEVAASKGVLSQLQALVGLFGGNLDSILAGLGASGPSQGAFSTPAPSFVSKTRPPAPIFSEAKDGTKITTWFEQLGSYASLLHLTPDTLVDHASLCLSGKAAEQWALIRKSLVLHG
jgi:hypothetical protein